MIYYLFLLIQIIVFQNALVTQDICSNVQYSIPILYNSNIYLISYGKICNLSPCSCNSYSYLTSETDATTPLYDGTYIITYTKNNNDEFKYIKRKVSNTGDYADKSVSSTLKNNGNVCLFQMIYLSNNILLGLI